MEQTPPVRQKIIREIKPSPVLHVKHILRTESGGKDNESKRNGKMV